MKPDWKEVMDRVIRMTHRQRTQLLLLSQQGITPELVSWVHETRYWEKLGYGSGQDFLQHEWRVTGDADGRT
jgi:hypothetical protein